VLRASGSRLRPVEVLLESGEETPDDCRLTQIGQGVRVGTERLEELLTRLTAAGRELPDRRQDGFCVPTGSHSSPPSQGYAQAAVASTSSRTIRT